MWLNLGGGGGGRGMIMHHQICYTYTKIKNMNIHERTIFSIHWRNYTWLMIHSYMMIHIYHNTYLFSDVSYLTSLSLDLTGVETVISSFIFPITSS